MVYEPETILYSLPDDLYSEDSPVLFCSAVLKREENGEKPFIKMNIRNVSEQIIQDMKLELILEPNGEKREERIRQTMESVETIQCENPVPERTETFTVQRIGVIFEDRTFWVGRGNTFRTFLKRRPPGNPGLFLWNTGSSGVAAAEN